MIELDKFLVPLKIPSEYGRLQRLCDDQEVLKSLAAWKNNVYNELDAEYTCGSNAGWEGTPERYIVRRSRFLRDFIRHWIRPWWVGYCTLVDACDTASCFRHHFRMWFAIALDNSYFNWKFFPPIHILTSPSKLERSLHARQVDLMLCKIIMREKCGKTILEFGVFLLGLSRIFL